MDNEQLVALIKDKIDVPDNMLKLWQQNRGFIMKMANRYKGYEDMEDLEQQGYIGLCSAVENYRSEEGVPFISYASFWIRQSMGRYIETSGSIVRIPTHEYRKLEKYKRLVNEFEIQAGRKPTDSEVCRYMGISHEALDNIRHGYRMKQIGSLDGYVADDDDTTVGELVPGHENVEGSVLDEIEMQELKRVLWPMVDALPEEEKVIIRSKYQQRMTVAQAGELIGMSRAQATAAEKRGMRKLRHKKNELRVFLPEAIESIAYRHNSVVEFGRTWTSSTELAALKL